MTGEQVLRLAWVATLSTLDGLAALARHRGDRATASVFDRAASSASVALQRSIQALREDAVGRDEVAGLIAALTAELETPLQVVTEAMGGRVADLEAALVCERERAVTIERELWRALVDAAFPPKGSCAMCGGDDARHRTFECIFERACAGETFAELALDYGVSEAAIDALVRMIADVAAQEEKRDGRGG